MTTKLLQAHQSSSQERSTPTLRVHARRETRRLLSLTSEVITGVRVQSRVVLTRCIEAQRSELEMNENSTSITSARDIGRADGIRSGKAKGATDQFMKQ